MWTAPPARLSPPEQGVHLWWVNLAEAPALWELLTLAEQARAMGYAHPEHQHRFVAGRAALRRILARYLGQPPAGVPLAVGQHGKPFVPGALLHFNVAHAGAGWLAGVTAGGPLGVDVVELTPLADVVEVARYGLTGWQARRVQASQPAEQLRRFWRYWTANEARLKADGRGLGGALTAALKGWRVRHFAPAPGYLAALAVPARARWPVMERWRGP